MSKERLYLFDTTLRDGAQTTGVDFSVEDKRRIAAVLDELGVDYIEGGYPGANATDTAVPRRALAAQVGEAHRLRHDQALRPLGFERSGLAGGARTRAPTPSASSPRRGTTTCASRSASPTRRTSQALEQSVKAVVGTGREALIDCEHFFDGYKGNRDYALAVARTAYEAGARWVVLCDTNGGTLPHEVERIVAEVAKVVPGTHLGIHTHNDTENAVANSLVAVRAGCRQIQGTLNGIGERCGNANLTSIIPTLLLKSEFAERFETGVTPERLQQLTHASRVLDEVLNRSARPARALRRRERVRDQGRHPCLGDPQGAGRPTSTSRPRASATSGTCWSPSRAASRTCSRPSSGSASPSRRTTTAA